MNYEWKDKKKEPVRGGRDTTIFDIDRQVKIGRTTFLVKRHFNGSKSLEEAIYQTVKNETVRERKSR